MRTAALIGSLAFVSCSGEMTAELKTTLVDLGGEVSLELINDSLEEARWWPCDQAWFIELEDGSRERDPTRPYCNLERSLHFGANDIRLTAPDRSGQFFVVLTVTQGRTSVEVPVGPIDVGAR
ncbi:MAG: hypothetical protein Q8N23_10620 [Archangium sp.]|nr:hypothetical protein [Archangium sp.]MDP3572248.1 hypothetical protein [Archangium sp.]